jgi:hypothetical protein
MAAPPEIRTWVSWSELVGSALGTLEEFHSLLRKYRRSSVLLACARLSVLFNYGPDADTTASEELAAYWAPLLFHPALVQRVKVFAEKKRIIFFQAQLRYLAAEVIRISPAPSEDLPAVPDQIIGELLLRSGELLYEPHQKPVDPMDAIANLVAQFLPVYEIDLPTDPFIQFLRFYIFLTVNIPRLPARLRTFDVCAAFEKQFGFPLKTYSHFIFCFAMHAMMQRGKKSLEAAIDSGVRIATFQHAKVPADSINQMFETVSFSLNALKKSKSPLGYADFEFLRDHPYFNNGEEIFCLDYEFALGKLESGALWRVLKGLDSEKREPYLSFWGSVFEDYVSWLFETYSSSEFNTIYLAPKYPDSEKQICDLILVCGSTAILIEAKLATCRAEVRYSGDYKKMRAFLEERLVCGTDRRVGVAQLLFALENITSLPASRLPSWLAEVRKIIPVIVTKDDIGSSWMTNTYLQKRFKQQKKKYKGYTVTPIVSMSISTLERSMKALGEVSFEAILEDRIQEDKNLGRPFEAASKYVQRGVAGKLTVHMDILTNLMNEVVADFGITDPPVTPASLVS